MNTAVSIFHEKTVAAVNFYNNSDRNWAGTSNLISRVVKVWKILNCKTPVAGKMKRDATKDPIHHLDDWKLDVLEEFRSFLNTWQQSKLKGLSRDTFLAWRQTLEALVACSKFLISKRSFNYVLLGKFQSDPIEQRFRWYRQMHGGNYYISVRQLFDSERKLRAISLTKFSGYTMNEMESVSTQVHPNEHNFLSELCLESPPVPDICDLNAIF